MTKLRTISMLQDALDDEIAWRIKELANLKIAVKRSQLEKKTLIRAAVCLMYAHWEGFIKRASLVYLNFVNNQRLNYNELSACFVVFGVKKTLADLRHPRKRALNISAVEFFLSRLKERAQLKFSKAIDTRSNLSSSIFDDIAISIGIDPTNYTTKYNLIDESLLKRRNRIAHGDFLDLDEDSCRQLLDEVISLLKDFKADIESGAANTAYLRTN